MTPREQSAKEEADFKTLIPLTGFFADYMEYTNLQESPASFHFWVAATIIGATLQRRAWVDKGAYLVYPNLFTVLVAPTGKCRKSTAINMGTQLLTGSNWVNIIADKTTPEGLVDALAYGTEFVGSGVAKPDISYRDSCGLIKASELAVFLNRASYNQDMITLLTTLYDCLDAWDYRLKTQKAVHLQNIAVSFLAASTADWFDILPKDAFGGGFWSRFILVVKEETDRRITMIKYKREEKAAVLRQQLLQIYASAKGAVRLTQEAYDWYVNWYNTHDEIASDEKMIGFLERKQDVILKLAIILAASHFYNIVDLSTIKQAYNIVTWTQQRAFDAFRFVGVTALGELKERITSFIREKQHPTSRGDVVKKFYRVLRNGVADIDAIEKMWNDTQEVEIQISQTTGRPKKLYIINKEAK